MIQDMSTAAATQRIVSGMKGPSPLLNVPGFDIIGSFNPDYIHCALLGVARQFAELWFARVKEEYYIGDQTNQQAAMWPQTTTVHQQTSMSTEA